MGWFIWFGALITPYIAGLAMILNVDWKNTTPERALSTQNHENQ